MLDPRTVADNLTREVCDVFGEEIRSVVLHGSVARGEAIPGVSDVNLLLLLETVSPSDIARLTPFITRWVGEGNTPPMLFSWDEWSRMGDTFAIEISDILDAGELVHGADPLVDVVLDPAELRLHVEREIRDTMYQFRLRMLLCATNPAELGSLMLSGIPSFSAYMRACLRLCGETPPKETESVIERAAALIGADPQPMLQCQEARRAIKVPRVSIEAPVLEGYLDFLQRLVFRIDRLDHDDPGNPAGIERPAFRGAR